MHTRLAMPLPERSSTSVHSAPSPQTGTVICAIESKYVLSLQLGRNVSLNALCAVHSELHPDVCTAERPKTVAPPSSALPYTTEVSGTSALQRWVMSTTRLWNVPCSPTQIAEPSS